MPIPKKKQGEKAKDYISRLISFFREEGRQQDQAIAMAYSVARKSGYGVPPQKSKKKKK